MPITVHLRTDMFNTVELVVGGVLAETMDKQALRIAELEAKARSGEALRLHALRLSLKPKKRNR